MSDVKQALKQATQQLTHVSDTARVDAEILLAHALMKSRTYLYAHPDVTLTKTQQQIFDQFIARRTVGEPIAYITGTREFWSLPLSVSNDTLIPRPETELLVELTLTMIPNQPHTRILDLGTGSGAIALALAKERNDWQITACDYSKNALTIAKKNAQQLGLSNVEFYQSDWFSTIPSFLTFQAIVSNPPYIAENDPHLIEGDVRFEPASALVSGHTGLIALEHIIKHSLVRLEPNGLLFIEHGFEQKLAIRSMLNNYGYKEATCWKDIQGNDRVSCGKRIIS